MDCTLKHVLSLVLVCNNVLFQIVYLYAINLNLFRVFEGEFFEWKGNAAAVSSETSDI